MEIAMDDFKEKFAYERAKKKVKEIRGFYMNLTCYCVVIPILIFVNLYYTPEYYWFPFSMCGWGIGLLLHGMTAFDRMPFFNKAWEERKMLEILENEKRKHENVKKFE